VPFEEYLFDLYQKAAKEILDEENLSKKFVKFGNFVLEHTGNLFFVP